jgi:hypothetical protein
MTSDTIISHDQNSRPASEDPDMEAGPIQEDAKTDPRPNETKNAENLAKHDEFVVYWNEPADQDPDNPLAWPSGRKWGIIATLSSITFLTLVFH